MKKKIIIPLLVGLILATPAQAKIQQKEAITDVNIRKQPTTDSQVIAVLSQGKTVKVIETDKDRKWDKVEYDNRIGYIYNRYLNKKEDNKIIEEKSQDIKLERVISLDDFRYMGIVNWGGWNWTYYLMSQFPGSTSTPVEGRYVNDEGFVCDNQGYIILASVDLPPYTIVDTPFGYKGKVYDTGCPSGILDVYTNW